MALRAANNKNHSKPWPEASKTSKVNTSPPKAKKNVV
jgi:hypothetical protein